MRAASGQRTRSTVGEGERPAAGRSASTSRRGYQAEPMAPRMGWRRPSFSSCLTLNSLANPSRAAASRRQRWSSNPDGGLTVRRVVAGIVTEGDQTPMKLIRQIFIGPNIVAHRGSIGPSSGRNRADSGHAGGGGSIGNTRVLGIKTPFRMELPTALEAQTPSLSPSEIFRGRNLFIL